MAVAVQFAAVPATVTAAAAVAAATAAASALLAGDEAPADARH